MTTLSGSRVDTWVTHVTVAGIFLGPWDQFSGGEADSEEALYRPSGFDVGISLGGRVTYGNVTVARYWDTWVNGFHKMMLRWVGKQRGLIVRYPFTADWVQLGAPQQYAGTLKRVSTPDVDSMGGDAALIEAEFTIDSVA
jgi:hypothetical protein